MHFNNPHHFIASELRKIHIDNSFNPSFLGMPWLGGLAFWSKFHWKSPINIDFALFQIAWPWTAKILLFEPLTIDFITAYVYMHDEPQLLYPV